MQVEVSNHPKVLWTKFMVLSVREKAGKKLSGRCKGEVFIRAHAKSLKKAKAKLKELTSRSQGRNVRQVMENVKVYIRGWLGYFWIADMKNTMQRWDEWLRRRFRVYIWKQWKVPSARIRNFIKLGISKR